MSLLKEVINGGIIGWSDSKKNSFLFAVAQTSAGEDKNNNNNYNENGYLLQIMTFDAAEKGLYPNRLGATLLQVPASSITWSTFGEDTNKYPYGLICLGHQDGSFAIYDANLIIQATKANPEQLSFDQGKICYIKEFSVPVSTIEYNSYKPNLIAIGGDEVLVIDISKDIENPDIIEPGENNLHQGGIITSVSWNKKVPHILASASNNGVAVVWNLKTSQVSFQIPDIYQHQTGPKQLSLAWNPEIPLQFAINYDDEKKPELHIWDLRDTRGPYVSLENGHIHGIQSLSWCSNDSSLIITGGVDNKVVCWNIKTKEIIQSFYLGTQIVNVQWSKIPSVYSVTLVDGTIQIYALNSNDINANPPKWYQPPVGISFAPSNNLISFSEQKGQVITSKQYQTRDENYQLYLRWFQELEKVIDDNNSTELCDFKLKNTHVEDTFELDQWRLLRGVAFGNNKEILESLGFKKSEIIQRAEEYTGKKHNVVIEEDSTHKNPQTKTQKQSIQFTPVNEEQAGDFFDNLTVNNTQNAHPSQPAPSAEQNGNEVRKRVVSNEEEVYMTELVSKNKNWDAGVEKMIKENMIVGNYEGAIDCAMKCGRVAEALLIAYSQSQELFKQSVDQYFTQQTDNFIKYVFKNLIKNDIEDIAENYDLKSWRECAGLAITCSKNPAEFQQLMNMLAERFVKEKNDDDSAICCFILSQNFQRLVEIYFKRIQALRGNIKQRAYYMVQSIEKLLILKKVMNEKFSQTNHRGQQQQQLLQHDIKFDSILLELSKIALSNNQIQTAYKILEQGNPVQLRVAELKDLLFNVYFDELASKFTKPVLPYSYVKIPTPTYNLVAAGGNNHHRKQDQQGNLNNNNFNNNNKQQLNKPAVNPPIKEQQVNPVNNRNIPFNPRGVQKEIAPPVLGVNPGNTNGQFGAPPPVIQPPPIGYQAQQSIQTKNAPFIPQDIPNHVTRLDNKPPIQAALSNTNNFNNKFGGSQTELSGKSGPPVNPNNKLFTEQVNSKNIAPPRPPVSHQAKNPAQLGGNPPIINNNAGYSNVPPPTIPDFKPAPPILNESINKGKSPMVPQPPNNYHPPVNNHHPHPPQNNLPPHVNNTHMNNQNNFTSPPPPPPVLNNSQQQLSKQDSNPPQNPNNNSFANRKGPNAPPTFNPNIASSKPDIVNTRPPITMNLNNSQINNNQQQSNNAPPPLSHGPPPLVGNVGSRTQSQQQNTQYQASPSEIQIIEGYITNNMAILGQLDPKKKDDHFSHLNNVINLLKTSQLKQEQVNLLQQICQEVNAGKQREALNTHSKLAQIDYSTHKHWITSLKRLIAQK